MPSRRELLRLSAAVAAAGLPSSRSEAQSGYPDHPVRLIVPRPAGGVVDIIAREWSSKVGPNFGATYIDNVGGAGGTIGASLAARAAADGYTLLFGTTSEMVLSPIVSHVSYDPVASFDPIAIICESTAAIVVNPSIPVTNLRELADYAKRNPGRLSYGSAGAGTVSNFAGELFKSLAGLPDITHIPYRGGNPAVTDLIGGQIPIMTPMMSEAIIALHRQGQLRIIAVASARRLTAMPDIGTAAEQGYPGLVAQLFVGLFAPAKSPPTTIAKIAGATRQAMQDSDLQKSFAAASFEGVLGSDPASAARYLNDEITRWKPVVEQSGLRQE